MAPKISCICVSQNGEASLRNAITYFFAQSYEHKELIVLYTATDEAIHNVAAENAAHRELLFKAMSNEEAENLSAQIRLALETASGNYIAVWNDNTSYASERLVQQYEFISLMQKPANSLASITLYNQTTGEAYFTAAQETGWRETLICDKAILAQLFTEKKSGINRRLYEKNELSIIDAPELCITVIGPEVAPEYAISSKLNALETEQIRKKIIGAQKIYDGILSLGAWCQVGAAINILGLAYINSPIHNFGVKTWKNLIDILESGFENYWERENMVIGKPEEGYSAQYEDTRPVYKVYCNNYNMISNHHFDVVDNTPEELHTYENFKQKIEVLSAIFQIQCQRYERVLFGCKIMSAPEKTVIEREDIPRLCNVLDQLRDGKPYDLRLSVPKNEYEKVLKWLYEDNLAHVSIYPWTIEWNNDVQDEEWQWMFGDTRLADNYFERLNCDIMGMEEISYEHIRYLNS